MKTIVPPLRSMRHLLAALALIPILHAATPEIASQFDFSSDTTLGARKFAFATVPGHRYTLWRSTDLLHWSPIPGAPQTATGLSIEHTFAQGVKEFFRIEAIDDQAPEVVAQSPGAGAFAVRRFEALEFELADATGIDPASIRLTIANGTSLTVVSPGISYAAGVLTYQNADTALGAYGATVPVVLVVADTLGHSLPTTSISPWRCSPSWRRIFSSSDRPPPGDRGRNCRNPPPRRLPACGTAR